VSQHGRDRSNDRISAPPGHKRRCEEWARRLAARKRRQRAAGFWRKRLEDEGVSVVRDGKAEKPTC